MKDENEMEDKHEFLYYFRLFKIPCILDQEDASLITGLTMVIERFYKDDKKENYNTTLNVLELLIKTYQQKNNLIIKENELKNQAEKL